jgi:hypothetical protein
MVGQSHLEPIRQLDPLRDHQKIVFLSMRLEFPFDTTRALELALFRTFCVPSISALLDRTGEFGQRAQKRYDDTDILISELVDWGYDSERGRRAISRMNALHGRFQIANRDFLYVLSTFIYEPIRWNARFGWRPLCEEEKLAYYFFWREVGWRMNIDDIPESYEGFEEFNRDFEQRHFRFSETNQRLGVATRELFVSWLPKPLAPLVRASIYALLDEPMLSAFGFPRPSRLMRWLVTSALRSRAFALRFAPPRRKPLLRTELRQATYPDGYTIEHVGPENGE